MKLNALISTMALTLAMATTSVCGAHAQTSPTKPDTTSASTTVINISISDLTNMIQAAANAFLENTKDARAQIAAAADSSLKVGGDALRQIIKVDAATAQQIMTAMGAVADSAATASKGALATSQQLSQAVADEVSKAIKEGSKIMAEQSIQMTQAQTDSLKAALGQARTAIDEMLAELNKKTN